MIEKQLREHYNQRIMELKLEIAVIKKLLNELNKKIDKEKKNGNYNASIREAVFRRNRGIETEG